MKRRRFGPALALLAAGCGGAGPAAAGEAVRTDSAGVMVVTSGEADRPLRWRIEAERVWGGEDSGPLSFYRVSGSLLSTDGEQLYVLDTSNARVLALHPDRGVEWTAGGAGGGPGELQSPNSLTLTEAGVLLVHDTRKGALVRYAAADGSVLEQWPLTLSITRAGLRHVEAPGSALALLSREAYAGSDERRVRLLRVAGADTVEQFARLQALSRTAHHPSCGLTLTLPVLFAPQIRWARHGERLAVTTDAGYVIDVFEAGGHALSVRRAIAPEPVTRSMAHAALQGGGAGGPVAACGMSVEARLEQYGYAPARQIVQDLGFDGSGRLWVQRRAGAELRVDVFEADGAYLGTMPAGTPFPLLFLNDGRVVYVERDALEVDRVVVGRLATG